MKLIVTILFILINSVGISQNYIHISGRVFDTNNESIEGVYVTVDNNKHTLTDNTGYFDLKMKKKNFITLKFSHTAYSPVTKKIRLNRDTFLIIYLSPRIENINKVFVYANSKFVNDKNLSEINFPVKLVNSLPVVLGTNDVFKSVQLMPGIQPGIEGTSNINIRGAASYQNLYLLEGIPVYYVSHFYGSLSIFNPNAIKSFKVLKGAIPAQYANFSSGVIDINMLDGNIEKRKIIMDLNILATSLSYQGELVKNKISTSAFIRRSLWDLVIMEITKNSDGNTQNIYFQDFYNKFKYRLNTKNVLYFTILYNKDSYLNKMNQTFVADSSNKFLDLLEESTNFGNLASAIKLLSFIKSNWIITNNISVNYYKYNLQKTQQRTNLYNNQLWAYFDYFTAFDLLQSQWKANIKYVINNNLLLTFGQNFSLIRHNFNKASTYKLYLPTFDSIFTNSNIFLDTISIGYNLNFYIQINYNYKFLAGFIGLVDNNYKISKKTYSYIEPRANLSFKLNAKFKLQLGYTESHQYLHVISSSALSTPGEVFMPSTFTIPPEHLVVYDFAIKYNNSNHEFSLLLDFYYKKINNILKYKRGTNLLDLKTDWTNYVEKGFGYAYGFEFFINYNTSKYNLLISSTLSRSWRKFPNINNSEKFPYKFDRPVVVNINFNYNITNEFKISSVWSFASGYLITIPQQVYSPGFPNIYVSIYPIYYYESVNNVRTPDYHRLDLSLSYHKEKSKSFWKVGIYNVYNRLNPTYMEPTSSGYLKGICLFPIMPFFSYRYELSW